MFKKKKKKFFFAGGGWTLCHSKAYRPLGKSPSHNFGTIRLEITWRLYFCGSRSSKINFWFLQFRKTGFLDTPLCIFHVFLIFSSVYCVSSLENTNAKRIEQKYFVKKSYGQKCLFEAYLHVKNFELFFFSINMYNHLNF